MNLEFIKSSSRRAWCALAAGALSLAAAPRPGTAQAARNLAPPLATMTGPDGVAAPIPSAARGFSLFANADLAGTSLKLKGQYQWAQFNGGGLWFTTPLPGSTCT